MAQHTISASALVPAPAREVYALIADYRDGHPRILPRPPFISLEVEQGGVGAGTVFRIQMRLLGRLQSFRGSIAEPEPGRVLTETMENGIVTNFVVEPRAEGAQAWVMIETTMKVHGGPLGRLEGWVLTRTLRPVYERELAQLAEVARGQVAGGQG